MLKNKKNVYADSMKLQDLEHGIYGIRTNNFNSWPFFHGKSLLYFIIVEFSGRPIIVEIDKESEGFLQAMIGKAFENITNEDGFKVLENHCVSIKFNDLRPGTYEICENTPDKLDDRKKYLLKVKFLERAFTVEFSYDDGSIGSLQDAMRKFFENIEIGDSFTIHKLNDRVTSNLR